MFIHLGNTPCEFDNGVSTMVRTATHGKTAFDPANPARHLVARSHRAPHAVDRLSGRRDTQATTCTPKRSGNSVTSSRKCLRSRSSRKMFRRSLPHAVTGCRAPGNSTLSDRAMQVEIPIRGLLRQKHRCDPEIH